MKRHVVAIVGSAGALSRDLRHTVETLALTLSKANFDLVAGGMDSVMHSVMLTVARGHKQSSNSSNLAHIEPGWERALERDPPSASVVGMDPGSMRNHLAIRSADLVVAVLGGSGTLSEIAVARHEGKPLAALRSSGGWGEALTGEALDHRREVATIKVFDTVDEVVAWAVQLRPEGVFAGRRNRGFYPLEVPALHRMHEGDPDEIHLVHLRYGMSVEKSVLQPRLETLDQRVESWNQDHDTETVALVTFDDGWKEVMCLMDSFEKLPRLRPVLFLGENHFQKPLRPLPLQRLYHHCAAQGLDPENAAALRGTTRTRLKFMAEIDQHAALDDLGIDSMLEPEWLLHPDDIARLKSSGWIIASHGHCHEDLTARAELGDELARLAESVEDRGHMPWLAWPEGRWSQSACEDARAAGFRLQFGLGKQPCEQLSEGTVTRTVWR